jgi:hypothetical protein
MCRHVPVLPFYSLREGPVIYERERKKEKKQEKNKRESRESLSCVGPLPLPVGPDGPVDDEGIPTLPSCLSLVPRVNRGAPYHPGGRYGQQTPLTETMPELEV